MPKIVWTIDKLQAAALEHTTRSDFAKGNRKAYKSASNKGLLDKVCAHMPPRRLWSKDNIIKEALKFKTRAAFKAGASGAYAQAHRDKIVDEVCSHMETVFTYWTKVSLQEEALKYTSKKEFHHANAAAYKAAHTRGITNEICQHMPPRAAQWKIEEIPPIISTFSSIRELSKGNQMLYKFILKNNLQYLLDPLRKLVEYDMELGIKGIYLLKDEDSIVYIGKSSTCIRSRIIAHIRDKSFNSVTVLTTSTVADIDVLELYFINKHNPQYNKGDNSGSKLNIKISNMEDVLTSTTEYKRCCQEQLTTHSPSN